ncbi:MAG: hypothetical protein FWG80_03275 [Alphaproteobacteria bacterium]|nr:hypothetical protein [Alphaproteobacteria bacterium]
MKNTMSIDYTNSLQQIKPIADVWCAGGRKSGQTVIAGECVASVEMALRIGARRMVVPAQSVNMIWSWLENKGIEIFAYLESKEFTGQAMKLSEQIQSVLKKGADGIIMKVADDISEIAASLLPVRNELFFGKKLFISLGLNITEPLDMAEIFSQLKSIAADGVVFDMRGSDKEQAIIAGKIYGILSEWDSGFKGQIMFLASAPLDMENAYRLTEKTRPELVKNLRFFIRNK